MSEPKRFYWLKLKEDFFRQKEIKKLRKIAGGDTFTIIYLKMLLRSLKDGGRLYYEGIEDNFASEVALDIDEDEDNVKMTVAFLISNGILVQNQTDEYEILTAREMTDSETDSAHRMRRLRAKQALGTTQQASLSDGDVTASDVDIEIDKRDRDRPSRRKRRDDVVSPGFTEFWNAYPRKVAKQNALKAWGKTGADDSQSLTDTILADVKRRVDGEWKGKEVQYIPHPATYLNQRRWEDESSATDTVEDEYYPRYSEYHEGDEFIEPEGCTPVGAFR